MSQNGCLTHTFWTGVLIAILVCFGFKGCQSTEKLPCYVQAMGDEDVAVRVGPGTQRAIRFYMDENGIYEVIGAATADDGSDWWQIEVEDIPQAWVAQSDVVSTGNCQGIGNADAPPIIVGSPDAPNIVPSPTQTPGDGVSPPSNNTPVPLPTQGQITNTPPIPTDPPTGTPIPTTTGTPG